MEGVIAIVGVIEGVMDIVGVMDGVIEIVGVMDGVTVGVRVVVGVCVGVRLIVGVIVGVGVGVRGTMSKVTSNANVGSILKLLSANTVSLADSGEYLPGCGYILPDGSNSVVDEGQFITPASQ